MSRAGRKTKRFKRNADVPTGPSVADYYRFRLSLPAKIRTQPTYLDYQRWRDASAGL